MSVKLNPEMKKRPMLKGLDPDTLFLAKLPVHQKGCRIISSHSINYSSTKSERVRSASLSICFGLCLFWRLCVGVFADSVSISFGATSSKVWLDHILFFIIEVNDNNTNNSWGVPWAAGGNVFLAHKRRQAAPPPLSVEVKPLHTPLTPNSWANSCPQAWYCTCSLKGSYWIQLNK